MILFHILFISIFCIHLTLGLNQIVIKGHKFFDSITKQQFFIKGVAYQPRSANELIDPLADPQACARDATLMSKLGLNLIRVYEVDPKKNHDQCMKSFSDAGIYVLLDIANPKNSINRQHPEYTLQLFDGYKTTVDAFHHYDNILAYMAGNEVTNDNTNTGASAFVKAALRDIKHYIKLNKTKYIPVGYASNDDERIREPIRDYFSCDDDASQVDFYGVNLYEWCGKSSYKSSGYDERTKEMNQYNKPVFLSEFGCNLVSPRPFTEVQAIYSQPMSDVWSGGVAYEWTQELNNYGLVKLIKSSNSSNEPAKAQILQDYTNLQMQLSQIDPQGVNMDDFDANTRSAPACPSHSANWKASLNLPPTPSAKACECMRKSVSCMASDKVSRIDANGTSAVGTQLDIMCGMTSCDEIKGDGESGKYGVFSFCDPTDKLTWLYHTYSQNNMGACDFQGNALKVTPQNKNSIETCPTLKPTFSNDDNNNNNNKESGANHAWCLNDYLQIGFLLFFSSFLFYN
ncbi:Glucanosyltransferase-domain-containing protein [Halteromyces radiatus]|uniref:Glucanosyltransferase-domain-containing protein n=1 Tax=Halteromyces radiatus TaxID=101107 RepID=UPI00221F646D|nr:Glucanosyltransferase-domain-containing protein [Halteromyces radiatus]KAI8097189.1 Glucanosyltransferase-domain-containing protein [Halteromyces radiatus]